MEGYITTSILFFMINICLVFNSFSIRKRTFLSSKASTVTSKKRRRFCTKSISFFDLKQCFVITFHTTVLKSDQKAPQQ